MRVPIAHNLPKEEVRRRLREGVPDLSRYVPGGMADVTTEWRDEDHMALSVAAMGQAVRGEVIVEERQVVFVMEVPPMLSFLRPVIEEAVRDKGQKLLL